MNAMVSDYEKDCINTALQSIIPCIYILRGISMSAFILKIIATVCMLIDHVGAVFDTPEVFRNIGRIAFPIYAFMIAQGCKKTRNIKNYLIRLGIFAVVSEIPFDLAFEYAGEINFLRFTNVFYTLFLGAACVMAYELINKNNVNADFSIYTLLRRTLAVGAVIPIIILAHILDTDYGMLGVIYIFVFYLVNTENRAVRTLTMIAVVFIQYGYPYLFSIIDPAVRARLPILPGGIFFTYELTKFWFALTAAVLVCVYNGKQGPNAKWVKWGFYAFYPVHIGVLALIHYYLHI
jgi:hypothetical protein